MGPVSEAGIERVEDQVPLHVGNSPTDQNAPQGLDGLFWTSRRGRSGCRFEGGWVVQQILGAEHDERLPLGEVIQEFMLMLWLGSS